MNREHRKLQCSTFVIYNLTVTYIIPNSKFFSTNHVFDLIRVALLRIMSVHAPCLVRIFSVLAPCLLRIKVLLYEGGTDRVRTRHGSGMVLNLLIYHCINVRIIAPEAIIIQSITYNEVIRNFHGYVFYIQIYFQLIRFHQ